jgi:hypothetical protein
MIFVGLLPPRPHPMLTDASLGHWESSRTRIILSVMKRVLFAAVLVILVMAAGWILVILNANHFRRY